MVSLTIVDRPGVLRQLSTFFQNPERIALPAERFNILSSLWGATSGVGSASFVLEPERDGEIIEDNSELLRVAAGLESWLAQTLPKKIEGFQHLRDPQVGPIAAGPETSLFAGRLLGEVRFGSPFLGDDPARDDRAANRFAVALSRFAAQLAERQVPICYFFSPTTWTEHRPRTEEVPDDEAWIGDCWWLRIGFGLPGDSETLGQIELGATALADELGLGLAFYEPDYWHVRQHANGELSDVDDIMSYHFVPTLEPLGSDEQPGPPDPAFEGVMVFAPATADIIADILSNAADGKVALYGCAMGVLFGHTIAHFVVAKGQVGELRVPTPDPDALGRSTQSGHRRTSVLPTSSTFATTGPVIAGRHYVNRPDKERFWIAWRCPERAGVHGALIDCVNRAIRTAVGVRGFLEENIVYEVSRVLEAGGTCAGKAAFVVDRFTSRRLWPDGIAIEESEFGRELEQELTKVAIGGTRPEDWQLPDAYADWRRQPVVVTHGEPAADPWAKLSLLAGGIPSYSESAKNIGFE